MKATRINFDEMWENHFDNYRGWLYVAECLFPCREPRKPAEDTIVREEYNVAYSLSESEDCPPDTLSKTEDSSSHSLSDHEDNQSNTLSYSEYRPSDIFYPLEKDDYYLSDFMAESHSYNRETENHDKTINIVHDNEKGNNTPVEDKKECCFIETDNDAVETLKDPAEPNKDTDSEKIVRCRTCIKQPDNIIFECDTGLGFAFVTPKEESLIYTPSRTCVSKTLGTISIDTTNLKKPKTKILFSCNICFIPRTDKGTSQLEFILSRSCNNSAESPVGNWIYDLADKSERVFQTFKFNYCSCNSFPGLYNYYIRVIPVYIRNCSVLITNCHIDAFAQSK